MPNVEVISSFSAGLIAGASGITVGHPLDTLKTRLQVGQPLKSSKFNLENIRQLYRGVFPPLLTAGAIQSINFSLYEGSKKIFKNKFQMDHLSSVFCGGLVSGALISILTAPISLIKIQQQIRTEAGLISCFNSLRKAHGIPALYRSFGLICFVESFGRAVYLWTYEKSKEELLKLDNQTHFSSEIHYSVEKIDHKMEIESLQPSNQPSPTRPLTSKPFQQQPPPPPPKEDKLLHRMLSASLAGCFSWFVVYPLDVVKTNLQMDVERIKYPTTFSCFQSLYQHSLSSSFSSSSNSSSSSSMTSFFKNLFFGSKIFFRGIGFTMIRAAPVAATILPMYEYTKDQVETMLMVSESNTFSL